MYVADVLRGEDIKGPPVTKEGIRGPTTSGLDDIWGGTSNKQFCSSTDPETMSGGTRVAEFGPDRVATLKEGSLGKRDDTFCRSVRKKVMVA
jgi:hypothetical protein